MVDFSFDTPPLDIKLQILRQLLIADSVHSVGFIEPMREDERNYEGYVRHKWNIQPAILRTSRALYHTGVVILYGCNFFKFCTAKTLRKFIEHINHSRLYPLSHLVRRLLLMAIIPATREAQEWTSIVTGGLFQRSFPLLKRVTVVLSPMLGVRPTKNDRLLSEAAFNELEAALKNNVTAGSIVFHGALRTE
ncbi:hypothetical protein MMC34_005055 [Xylographa carneopallida]|nr:hypothetical protein [Xylographa carneopallida]